MNSVYINKCIIKTCLKANTQTLTLMVQYHICNDLNNSMCDMLMLLCLGSTLSSVNNI